MKKLSFLFAAAVIVMFSACNSYPTTAKFSSEVDSLNYAFGVYFGNNFKRAFGEDTTTTNYKAFLTGFKSGFKVVDEKEKDKADAKNAAISFTDSYKDGYLFYRSAYGSMGDSSFVANKKLIEQTINDVLAEKELQFDNQTAFQYYYKLNSEVHDSVPKKLTQEQIDSLNVAFVVMRSSGLLTRIDSAKKADFVKNFKQGLKIKSNSEKYKTLGFLQAASGYEFFNKSGVVGDSTITLNPTIFIAGLNAGMLNDTTVFTIAEIDEYLRSTMEKRQKAQVEKQFGANRKAGDDFLVENAKRESVKVTESGLQYEILKEGKGTKPTESDVVKVHYHGTLIDGTVFDSSVERGEPATFGVGQVIKGWTEALQLMPTGSKWKLYIPQELAYGEKNTGSIKPFSALIFEVELLEIEKPAEKK